MDKRFTRTTANGSTKNNHAILILPSDSSILNVASTSHQTSITMSTAVTIQEAQNAENKPNATNAGQNRYKIIFCGPFLERAPFKQPFRHYTGPKQAQNRSRPRKFIGPNYTQDGQPICYDCSRPGHIQRMCPRRASNKNQNKIVRYRDRIPSHERSQSPGKQIL